MNPSAPRASNSFRYFVLGVVCVAVLLGVYFVRLNAAVDQQREEAAERLTLCRQVENIARAALPGNLAPGDACKELKQRQSRTEAP